MPDFRGLVPALLIAGAVAGAVGTMALYGVVTLIRRVTLAHVDLKED